MTKNNNEFDTKPTPDAINMLPKYNGERDFQIIGKIHNSVLSISTKVSLTECFAGEKPVLSITPSAIDLASGKIVYLRVKLKAEGKKTLIDLLTSY